ncbi:MAG: ribosomal protein S6 modification protein, ribosomal protein S6 modification protein [Candidatus Peregrinibacteria bacterium GW2011_GWF2_33_10]|nr:MAG: ribosomal protein S6 modification protein, ribosomal protein S6 modification protein [Candidatus Peregrinibacteria bacterium GW2011_GWF2_33_10]OGJ43993.1 MAG: hypothetical protein A2272_05165 [Candidatus Peregrinibacteria bacterium RIFOXYA12_FULL_33_12]OGJ45509.1 MAG: hypothetical protein A2263_05920 [Candidatus Peregrinibacteria bacterium RIFOXYA2_FULL_33_21]OGJ50016.1 MAG: hypothetical protein A2307_04580 [Candidatus Peregrinibacteria bacterium RIFOXYB2_FULL_33_20]
MKFYCLVYEVKDIRAELLEESCKKRNLDFVLLKAKDFDYTQKINLDNNLLYMIDIDHRTRYLEKFLLRHKCVNFYLNDIYELSKVYLDVVYEKYKLPIIKTIYDLTNNKILLKKYVDYLDGFPLIIKVIDNSRGIGVIKVDSFESLLSIVDYLLSQNLDKHYLIKKFIDYTQHARLIVLGNKVIDSIEYKKVTNDFRSNAGDALNVVAQKFSDVINNTAIKATQVRGVEFAGVDVLIDKAGGYYLAEVNSPCYFPRCQLTTGVDISGMMVDFLINKSKNNNI